MKEILKFPPAPGSPEWRGMVSASKVPAILGLSRYTSQYRTWHEMAGNLEPAGIDSNVYAWGHIAEKSIAAWWKHQHPGWQLNRPVRGNTELAYRDTKLPFQNVATIDRRAYNRNNAYADRFHIVECKTARSLDDWGRPGEEDSVPADYYAQVQFQMGVSGIKTASVCVLAFGQPEIHRVEFDAPIFRGMVEQIEKWCCSLRAGTPPPLDSSVATYEAVRGLHPDIEKGARVEIDHATAVDLATAVQREKDAKAAARLAKSTAGDLMGRAQYLYAGETKVATRVASKSTPYVKFSSLKSLGGHCE